MIDKILGIDVELPTPEEFTKELVKDEKDLDMILICIEEYSRIYHECSSYIMNGELDKARALRASLGLTQT